MPLFSKLTRATISTLIFHFKFAEFKYNEIVYNENEESNNLYLVKSGEFKVNN